MNTTEHIDLFRIPEGFRPRGNPRLFVIPIKVKGSQSSDNFILELWIKNTGEVSIGGFQGDRPLILPAGLYYQANGSWGLDF